MKKKVSALNTKIGKMIPLGLGRAQTSCLAGLPDFSWCNIPKRGKIYQMTIKYSVWPQNIQNDRKINKMAVKQPFPLQGPPKYSQIGIFGMKIGIPSGNPAAGNKTKPLICRAAQQQFIKKTKPSDFSFPRGRHKVRALLSNTHEYEISGLFVCDNSKSKL
jgi:hypothetical protein